MRLSPARWQHDRGTLAERAYLSIRSAMFHQRMVPTVLYSENWVGQELGISRTPAREALRELEVEGLVEVVPQRGFRIKQMTSEDVEEFYALREMLEVHAVRNLCRTLAQHHIETLRHLVDQQHLAYDDIDSFMDLDEDFHLGMAEMAGLSRTARMVKSLRGVLWLLGARVVVDPSRQPEVVREHTTIIDALEERDADAAASAISQHIRSTAVAADVRLQQTGQQGPAQVSGQRSSTGRE